MPEPITSNYFVTASVDGNNYVVATAASGTLTLTANAQNNETVTIDTKVYTFQTTLTNVDGNVKIGASANESLRNLVAAIMRGNGSGVFYAAATLRHPSVVAVQGSGDTLVATANVKGTSGNSIATTETLANGSWGGATLSGGQADDNDAAPGFAAAGFVIRNRGTDPVYFSADGTNNHGRIEPSETLTFEYMIASHLWFKRVSGAASNSVDVTAWG